MKVIQTGANSYANSVAEINLATGEYRGDKASAYALASTIGGSAAAFRLLPQMRQIEGPVCNRATVGGSFSFRPCM